jgi:hypothetical protein
MKKTMTLSCIAGAALGLCAPAALGSTMSNDEVRAIVAEMMSDAETRSSLLQGGGAGYDGQFFLAGDGFRLNVGGMIQFRYTMTFTDSDGFDDGFESGFENRRTKLAFSGTLYDDWFFRVVGGFDRSGDGFNLEDAYIGYTFEQGFKAMAGQFKAPVLREEMVRSSKQLAAERSATNEFFTHNWVQGIAAVFGGGEDDWKLYASINDGANSQNSPFEGSNEADFAATARFEYKFAGEWSQFDDFTSRRGDDFAGMIGAAGHFQTGSFNNGFIGNTNNPADIDINLFLYTVDVSLEGDAWNLYAAFIGRYLELKTLGAGKQDLNDFGLVIQGGYRFTDDFEVFARYDGIFADSDWGTSDDTFNFITFGINQYYHGHAAKATVDVVIALDELTDLYAIQNASGTGFVGPGLGLVNSTNDTQVAVRFQFQLLF